MTESRTLRQRRRFWLWFWILLPIGFLNLVEFVPLGQTKGILSFHVQIRFEGEDEPEYSARALACFDRETAESALANPTHEDGWQVMVCRRWRF